MKNWRANEQGFTLAEVLVAIGVFSVAAVIATSLISDVVKMERKTAIEAALYEDTKIILQQLTNEIQAGTVDYDEYYSVHVVQAYGDVQPDRYFGANYGVYGSRFYDPGKKKAEGGGVSPDPTSNPNDLGTECSFEVGEGDDRYCEIVFTHSSDINVGQNPYVGDANSSNAICDQGEGSCDGPLSLPELFLIDSSGRQKTIIGKKKMNNRADDGFDWAIGLVRLEGRDHDQNGKIDIFGCDQEFNCLDGHLEDNPETPGDESLVIDPDEEGLLVEAFHYPFIDEEKRESDIEGGGISYFKLNNIRLPSRSDLLDEFDPNVSHFLPISPARANVKSLHFIVTPLEDPYRAFAERDVQVHPSVTIVMTIGLSELAEASYPGEFPDITVQTTVAAGVVGSVNSYPPIRDLRFDDEAEDGSWLSDKVPPLGL
jgi:prepilin-type N-terminal cleavage/methylation domain-containing protein